MRAFAALALLAAAGPAWAQSAQAAETLVTNLVRERYAEIRRCYDLALARDGKAAGSVGVIASLAPGGAVAAVRVDGDTLGEPRATECLTRVVASFEFRGFSEPADVALPLRFDPPPRQYAVRADDAPAYPILGGLGEARVLLDAATVGAKEASLTRLTLRPGAKVPLHAHPESAEFLYVLAGAGRMRGPKGEWREIGAGTALSIPAGSAHAFEATGTAPVEAVQVYAPGGAEQRFRDPARAAGTRPVAEADAAASGPEPSYETIDRLALPAGAAPAARLLYVVGGTATIEIAGERIDLWAGTAAYVPARDARVTAAKQARIVRWPAP